MGDAATMVAGVGGAGLDEDPEELRARYRFERDKRLRSDGNEQYVEVVGEFAHYAEDPYVEPGFTRDPLSDEVDVVVIGGGFGGLITAARLKAAGFDVRIMEKAGDFGGTWYWNRYPGVMCDVESYIYLPLLEEIGYTPKFKYAPGHEIRAHAVAIARHYGLYEKACLQTGVTRLEWDAARGRWIVFTDRQDMIRARYVAMAPGPLSRPKLPGIPGLLSFRGHTFHTSRWDYGYTGGDESGGLIGLAGKRVGIIGTGATGIQCIPRLAEWADRLYVFQRTPSAVDSRDNRPTDLTWGRSLAPGWQKRRMENFNAIVNAGNEEIDLVGDGWTRIFRNLTVNAAKEAGRQLGRRLTPAERDELLEMADFKAMEHIRKRVDHIVADKAAAEALKPWYHRLCKRPCFHDEYLDTFNRGNVTLVDTEGIGVERVTEHAVVVQGRDYEVDCLIFATGFEVGTDYTRRASYDVIGRDGIKLSEKWSEGLRTFHGLFSHDFPNCFFLGMTQTGVTVNFTHMLLEQAGHLAYVLTTARERGAEIVETTAEAEDEWVAEIRQLADRPGGWNNRYLSECTPSYFNSEGNVTNPKGIMANNYGRGPVKFFALLEEWRATGELKGLELR
jgi:cyclohexanone monooxygenase